jgi:hypothetical protein
MQRKCREKLSCGAIAPLFGLPKYPEVYSGLGGEPPLLTHLRRDATSSWTSIEDKAKSTLADPVSMNELADRFLEQKVCLLAGCETTQNRKDYCTWKANCASLLLGRSWKMSKEKTHPNVDYSNSKRTAMIPNTCLYGSDHNCGNPSFTHQPESPPFHALQSVAATNGGLAL